MPLDYDQIMHWPLPPLTQSYTERDTILYALGVGVTVDPMDPADLKYVYEGDGFVALPTMAAILGQGPFWMADPRLGLDWKRILHGEQMLKLYASIPVAGTIISQDRVEQIVDKGAEKGAICYMLREIRDTIGALIAEVRSSAFLRSDGGFGGTSEGAPLPQKIPDNRAPDHVIDLTIRSDQAIIYRLSGDLNPLHIDPKVATAAGFPSPILHGLCGYAIAGRAIIRALCGNDPARLRELNVRFASPMMPGDTLRIEIWKVSDDSASFRASAVERAAVVLNNGFAIVAT